MRPRQPAGTAPSLARDARRVVAAGGGLAALGSFPLFFLGALSVQVQRSLQIGPSTLGIAVAAFFAASALTVGPLGALVERQPVRRSLRVPTACLVLVLLALATLVRDRTTLVVVMVLAGVANSMVGPALGRLFATQVPPSHRGLAFAVGKAAVVSASILGGVAVPLVALTVGWRWVYVIGAALGLLLFLVLPPVDAHLPPRRLAKADQRISAHVLYLAAAFGLGTAVGTALMTFLVDFLVTLDVPEGAAGLTLAAGSVLALVSRLWAGRRVDRRGHGTLGLMQRLLAAGAIGLMLLAVGSPWVLPVALVLAFVAGHGWQGLMTYALATGSRPAAATGVGQTGASIGGVVGPVIVGFIAEDRGYPLLWLALAGMSVLAAVCVRAAAHTLDVPAGHQARPDDTQPASTTSGTR